ncbi:MAG: site-2 protease family protein [Thermoanaerobaculales bacterium]|nr:site-2 protease family protein [Thermoanaerobaculales bacterium]
MSIHWSFLLLMLFLGWRTAFSAGARAAAIEQGLILAVFCCVALHELGHAAVAVRQGVPISGITLYPFGGVARMTRRPPRGRTELLIAAAGPGVNLAIAAVLFLLSGGAVLSPEGPLVARLLAVLFWANLILAGFNLLPAFPLDGGRMLRGVLSMRLGWARATIWAASIGQVAAVVLILVGLMQNVWLVVAGLLILPAANAELRYALAVRQFSNRLVGDLVRTQIIEVEGETTVSEVAELSVATPIADFLITENGRPAAFLSAPKLWSAVRSDEPGTMPAIVIAEPLASPVPAEMPVEDAIALFDAGGPTVAVVADARGRVLGVAAVGDLVRAARLARHASAR